MVLKEGREAVTEAEDGISPGEKGRMSALKITVYVLIADLFYLAGIHCRVFKQGAFDAVHP